MKDKMIKTIENVKKIISATEEGAKAIIVEVVLIVVAVAVCLAFKDTISGVLEELMISVKENIKSIF